METLALPDLVTVSVCVVFWPGAVVVTVAVLVSLEMLTLPVIGLPGVVLGQVVAVDTTVLV